MLSIGWAPPTPSDSRSNRLARCQWLPRCELTPSLLESAPRTQLRLLPPSAPASATLSASCAPPYPAVRSPRRLRRAPGERLPLRCRRAPLGSRCSMSLAGYPCPHGASCTDARAGPFHVRTYLCPHPPELVFDLFGVGFLWLSTADPRGLLARDFQRPHSGDTLHFTFQIRRRIARTVS